eukprot:749927-Hanusia_phi.AAC.5
MEPKRRSCGLIVHLCSISPLDCVLADRLQSSRVSRLNVSSHPTQQLALPSWSSSRPSLLRSCNSPQGVLPRRVVLAQPQEVKLLAEDSS